MHPILINLGFWRVPTYGVLIAAAYLVAIFRLKSQIRCMPGMNEDKFWTVIYSIFLGALVGGKLLYVAVEWSAFRSGELRFFRDFRYGFVFFGGFLGALAAVIVTLRKLRLPFWETADYLAAALPLGQSIGRLGCLTAGCCYGRPTNLHWAVRLGGDPASVTPRALWGVPLHPTQLYESAADFAIALFLWKAVLTRVQKKNIPAGSVLLLYLVLYSTARFIIEFFRGDDRGWSFASLWVSQWIALGLIATSLALFWRRGFRKASS